MTAQPGAESAQGDSAGAQPARPGGPTQADRYAGGILSHELPTELSRLQIMERMLDPEEITALSGLGIQPSWHCLELGAGAGSIARWLAERCPAGRVVATDVDPSFLDPAGFRHLEVVVHDVERDDFPAESFDLVHARALFAHLANRDDVVKRAASWLRPGGRLMIGEADMFPVDSTPYPLMRQMWSAAEQLFVAQGSDPRWARRLPIVFGQAGLVDVGMSITLDVVGGGGLIDEFWKSSFAQVKPFLVERGLVSEAVYADAHALVDDPAFRDSMWAYIRVWGRRPG
jgi:SAM-dependent methyltransferase